MPEAQVGDAVLSMRLIKCVNAPFSSTITLVADTAGNGAGSDGLDFSPRRAHPAFVGVTYLGSPVPTEHRVDSFREFGATGLADAAGVNPDAMQALAERLFAAINDLEAPFFCNQSENDPFCTSSNSTSPWPQV